MLLGGGGGGGSITAAVKAVKMERYLSAVPVMASPPPPNSNSNAAVGNGEEEAFELQLKEMRPLAPSFQHGPVCTAVDGCALCGEAALRVCVCVCIAVRPCLASTLPVSACLQRDHVITRSLVPLTLVVSAQPTASPPNTVCLSERARIVGV